MRTIRQWQMAGLDTGWPPITAPSRARALYLRCSLTATRTSVSFHAASAVLMIALFMSGCASAGNARHIATVSIVTAHSILSKIQDTEMQVACGKPTAPAAPQCVPEAKHRDISEKFAQAFDYDGKIAQLVRAAPDGAPTSAEVLELLGKLQTLVSTILADIPSSPKKDTLLSSLGGAQ